MQMMMVKYGFGNNSKNHKRLSLLLDDVLQMLTLAEEMVLKSELSIYQRDGIQLL
jgi:hypothetical protein